MTRGVMVMIGAGPSYDKLGPEERGEAYHELIRSGVDIIETDRPVEVAKAITPFTSEKHNKFISHPDNEDK